MGFRNGDDVSREGEGTVVLESLHDVSNPIENNACLKISSCACQDARLLISRG